jgi:hypothetical protein
MDTTDHDLSHLFLQLGLPGEPSDIDRFVSAHRLARGTPMLHAPFWTPAQAAFLQQAVAQDSEWTTAVDELAVRLS